MLCLRASAAIAGITTSPQLRESPETAKDQVCGESWAWALGPTAKTGSIEKIAKRTFLYFMSADPSKGKLVLDAILILPRREKLSSYTPEPECFRGGSQNYNSVTFFVVVNL